MTKILFGIVFAVFFMMAQNSWAKMTVTASDITTKYFAYCHGFEYGFQLVAGDINKAQYNKAIAPVPEYSEMFLEIAASNARKHITMGDSDAGFCAIGVHNTEKCIALKTACVRMIKRVLAQ